jgi:hypothetical protein
LLLVDLQSPALATTIAPGTTYAYGNNYRPPVSMMLVPAAQFRAAIFLQNSPPMTALDWATP